MKKIVLSAALLVLSACSLYAQTEKGTFALGFHNFSPSGVLSSTTAVSRTNLLGFAFGTAKEKVDGNAQEDEIKYSIVGLNFNGHYFLIDNLSAGLGLNYYSQNEKEDNSVGGEDETTATIFFDRLCYKTTLL